MNILKEYFDRFLAAHRSRHLFRRKPILESLKRDNRSDRVSELLNQRLVTQAHSDMADLLTQFETSEHRGA